MGKRWAAQGTWTLRISLRPFDFVLNCIHFLSLQCIVFFYFHVFSTVCSVLYNAFALKVVNIEVHVSVFRVYNYKVIVQSSLKSRSQVLV